MRPSGRRAGRRTALRKSLTILLLLAGSLFGSLFYRRRSAHRKERVELYAGDGTMASLADGTADAERMLALARDVLALPG